MTISFLTAPNTEPSCDSLLPPSCLLISILTSISWTRMFMKRSCLPFLEAMLLGSHLMLSNRKWKRFDYVISESSSLAHTMKDQWDSQVLKIGDICFMLLSKYPYMADFFSGPSTAIPHPPSTPCIPFFHFIPQTTGTVSWCGCKSGGEPSTDTFVFFCQEWCWHGCDHHVLLLLPSPR